MGEVTVDQVWQEKDGTVALVLRQTEPWDTPGVMTDFQAKINGYVSVICDGPLTAKYPEYRGRKCQIRLLCYYDIPPDLWPKLDQLNHRLNQLGIGFVVMQIKTETPQQARQRLKKSVRSFFARLRSRKT